MMKALICPACGAEVFSAGQEVRPPCSMCPSPVLPRRDRLARGGVPERFRDPWPGGELPAKVREWAALDAWALVLTGDPGTGKSHLSTQVAAELTDEGGEVCWLYGPKISDDRVDAARGHVVILDDLGAAERPGGWATAEWAYVLRLVNDVYNSKGRQRLVTTTNLGPTGLLKACPFPALPDRLHSATWHSVKGPSLRVRV